MADITTKQGNTAHGQYQCQPFLQSLAYTQHDLQRTELRLCDSVNTSSNKDQHSSLLISPICGIAQKENIPTEHLELRGIPSLEHSDTVTQQSGFLFDSKRVVSEYYSSLKVEPEERRETPEANDLSGTWLSCVLV